MFEESIEKFDHTTSNKVNTYLIETVKRYSNTPINI